MVRADPGGGGGSIAAIDPQLMAQMNGSIRNGGETLVNQGGNLRSQFSNLYLDTSPLAEIVSIGYWAQDQLPMLTRRQTLAAAIDDTPGAHFHDEYATGMDLSPAQAAQQGSDPARQFMELDSTDAEGARRAHEIAGEPRRRAGGRLRRQRRDHGPPQPGRRRLRPEGHRERRQVLR